MKAADLLVLTACEVDLCRATVRRGARELRLTRLEHALLVYLAARPGQVVPREELLEQVWGYRVGVRTRTLDSTVQRLRTKLEHDPKVPRHIKTAYGIGFRFEPAEGPVAQTAANRPAPALVVHDVSTSFVGRQDELATLTERFESGARLVSVLGTAGAGKTRLARRYASIHHQHAIFVDLSAVEDRAELVQAVARTLSLTLRGADPGVHLARALRGRGDLLVVLDNFEQLVTSSADVVERWLEQAPGVQILATSRHALQLPAEHELRLGPLGDGAMELLVQRMRQANHRFDGVHDDNMADLLAIVELLDGLPLALELAASQARLMSARELRRRLQDGLTWLRRPGRSARRSTLQGALQWSFDQLESWQQQALAQCSVFAGGCSIEAAEAVVQVPGHETLHALQGLLDHSLLNLQLDADEPRFVLLRSIHEFSSAYLRDDGAANERHGRYFAALVSEDEESLVPDADNFRLACFNALQRGDTEVGYLAGCGAIRCARRGDPLRVIELTTALLEADLPADRRWWVWIQRGRALGEVSGPQAAIDAYQRAVELAGSDAQAIAESTRHLGFWHFAAGRRAEAKVLIAEALRLHRQREDRENEAVCLRLLGMVHSGVGELAEARRAIERALVLAKEVESVRTEALCLASLALLANREGDFSRAHEAHLSALAAHRRRGAERSAAVEIGNLGSLLMRQGWVDRAWGRVSESKRSLDTMGATAHTNRYNLAALLIYRGELQEARRGMIDIEQVAERGGRAWLASIARAQVAQIDVLRRWDDVVDDVADDAIEVFEKTAASLQTMRHPLPALEILLLHAALLFRLDRWSQARVVLDHARAVAGASAGRVERAEVDVAWARLLVHDGDDAAALVTLDAAESVFKEAAAHLSLGVLMCTRAWVHRSVGRDPGPQLRSAREMALRLGMGDRSALGRSIAYQSRNQWRVAGD